MPFKHKKKRRAREEEGKKRKQNNNSMGCLRWKEQIRKEGEISNPSNSNRKSVFAA